MRRLLSILVGALLAALAGAGTATADDTAFPLRPGDSGAYVALMQDRLSWLGSPIATSESSVDTFGPTTLRALHAFQAKFGLRRADTVPIATWTQIRERAGIVGSLPEACTEVTSICIDLDQRLLRYVVDGEVRMVADARFGMTSTPTGRGTFRVHSKSRDHWSTLFHTSMPYALFFNGGQAVHYSAFFARDGYSGASHGCVNLRDRTKAAWLFDRVPVGTRVHVA